MKHFRSLLSLGAIEDDEHIEPFQLNRIRSLQPKSTRLSQRKRQSKLLSDATTNRPSFTTSIDGKKLPELLHSISTKQAQRQFNFKKQDRDKKKNSTNTKIPDVDETREIYLEHVAELEDINIFNEWNESDQLPHFDFDLQLPTDTFSVFQSQSPNVTPKIHNNCIKPRLNSELPSPLYPQHDDVYCNATKLQLNMLLPPPMLNMAQENREREREIDNNNKSRSRSISINNNCKQYYNNYLAFNPENSITSIKSESNPAQSMPAQRTSINSWPSSTAQSMLTLNNHTSSKSTQIRANQLLSPIYDDERAYGMHANPWKDSPHLSQIVSAVQELTDDDEEDLDIDDNKEFLYESEIENEINDEHHDDTIICNDDDDSDDDDDEYRPRLATIVSQASSVNNVDPLRIIQNIHKTYSFPSSQRTSHTMTTNNTISSLESGSVRTSIMMEDEDDVNVAFEYIPDLEEHNLSFNMSQNDDDDDEIHENEIERLYLLRRLDVLLERDFPWYDFELMSQIGRGAYGVVDKSFHLKSCQIVAMKRSRSLKKQMMDSFKREVLICSEFVECPYIINMIECGVDQTKNEICIALEYMNMASLTSRVDYSLREIQKICFCVLSALEALHFEDYVHNDIKPDNILLNSNFDVKLTDFGCCQRMKDVNTPLTQANGSLLYQSYEKKFLSPIQYTTKSDIYSFGITIAEILNKQQEEEEEENHHNKPTPYKIPHNVMNEYQESAPQCIDFLQKCLIRDSTQRWSASQLLSHPFLMNASAKMYINCAQLRSEFYDVDELEILCMDDLEFITKTLINYYLNYNKSKTRNTRNQNENLNNFFRDLSKTPIDDEYSDTQRIQNIANCTGFSVEAVQDFIFRSVNGVKNKYLKR